MKVSRRIALIMAGGGGTRLWPASSPDSPKHVLPGLPELGSTLLSATVDRLDGLIGLDDVFVITTADQTELVTKALPNLPRANVLAEPYGRNTAPCVALSVVTLRARLGAAANEVTVVALPADHFVGDPAAFRDHLRVACEQAEGGQTVATLGIQPTRPDTGYGYMERDASALGEDSIPSYRALRFVEKPDADTAKRYVESGHFLWNAGIFAMPLPRIERDFARLCPQTWSALQPVAEALGAGNDPTEITKTAYASVDAAPLDIAVMEKLDDIVVVPADVGWSDLGSWESIAGSLAHQKNGNVVRSGSLAKTEIIDSTDTVVWNDDGTVGVLGVSGLAVVVSGGKVLVCSLERAQDVRALAKALDP